ncbi:MAG: hypothetical protein CSA66_03075 [Proteobacteria bacterium]|nr:MAG: hypothetical protein CSA66_03075 [Pseudomonadota bacterium]
MGDARTVVQMREDDKKNKQDKAAPAVERAAVPARAMAAPGAALGEAAKGVDLSGFAESLLASLQEAGGNTAVHSELVGLQQGATAANKAATDKATFDALSDVQKVAFAARKNGGQLPEPSGRKAPAAGEPPPGMDPPASVVAFHAQRAADMSAIADSYGQMAARASQLAGTSGLDEMSRAAFSQAAAQYSQLNGEYAAASATYSAISADMATNEFAGVAVPPSTVGPLYQSRLAILQAQQATLSQAAAAQAEQITAAQAEQAQIQAQLEALAAQQAAAAGGGDAAGGADADAGGDQAAELEPQRQALQTRAEAAAARARTAAKVGEALSAQAQSMQATIGAYQAMLSSSAATPTGMPERGGGE